MIYIDGKYYNKEDAKISVYDHGLLYGDGIFEGIRIYNGKIFRLEEHVDRLYESANAIYLDIGMTKHDMKEKLIECAAKSGRDNAYIRLVVTRGDGSLGVDPSSCSKARVIIIVDDIKLYPKELYTKGIKIVTSTYRRIPVESFDVRIKSLNYLNNILAKMEAKRNNCMECLILNKDGYVVECTVDNIFMIKDGIMKTPDCCYGALNGITRRVALQLGEKLGLNPKEVLMARMDLYNADEVFLTGTGAGVIPVTEIDGIKVKDGVPGKYTIKIMSEFTN
jgi:branched-chain amino acid aminotransferase